MSAEPFQNGHLLLPDICRNSSILLSLIVVQIIAIAISLVTSSHNFFLQLATISFYFLWVTLLSTFLLCKLRHKIRKQPMLTGFITALGVCLMAVALIEVFSQLVQLRWSGGGFDWLRFFRNMGAATLVVLLILRFFSLLGVAELRHKAEAESRLQSLQSRIRPHFLFNSLNTISELAAVKSDQTEEAISSLALLFRAGIEQAKDMHSLHNEVSLCKRYTKLEKLRFGDKLNIGWNLDVVCIDDWQVPTLIMQPLVENAILHGQNREGKVTILVDVKETATSLSIMVLNKKNITDHTDCSEHESSRGNGVALDNIRERLFVLYDDKQAFKITNSDSEYQVIMRIPKERLRHRPYSHG